MCFIVLQIILIYNLIVWVWNTLKSNIANPASVFSFFFLAPSNSEFKISKKTPQLKLLILWFALTDIITDIINLLLYFCWQKQRLIYSYAQSHREKERKDS